MFGGSLASSLLAALMIAAAAPADEPGSIRGRVVDSATGEPVAEASVFVDSTNTSFRGGRMMPASGEHADGFAVTGSDGRFTLSNVPPGRRSVTAVYALGFLNTTSKIVYLAAGQTIEDVGLRMIRPATVAGRVADDKGEPLPGAIVRPVLSEYHAGKIGHYLGSGARTDENGEYEIKNLVPAGRRVRLMAAWAPSNYRALAVADAPLDPKRRRPAYSRVFYPGALDLAGGMALDLRSGERREGVDFQLWREPSLSIEGKVVAPPEVPRLRVLVDQEEPGFGLTKRAGYFGFSLTDVLEGAREFRVCGLGAGSYRVRVHDEHGGTGLSVYGVASVLLVDRDVKGVQVVLTAPWRIPVRVEWAGDAPKNAPAGQARIFLRPLTRTPLHGEQETGSCHVPGSTELERVLLDEYTVSVVLPGLDPTRAPLGLGVKPGDTDANAGFYVKDIRYGNESAVSKPIRIGAQAADAPIRVLVGHGAGTVRVRVTDDRGNAAADVFVYLLPMDARDEADLSDRLIVGYTDQHGTYTWFRSIPPGRYRAVATPTKVDYTPEFIGELWRARGRAPESEVPSNGSAEVEVKLTAQP